MRENQATAISGNQSVHIIAEAGSNHNGKEALARELIGIAAEARVDSVKFQLINPGKLYVPQYVDETGVRENLVYKQRGKEQLPLASWVRLGAYAAEKRLPLALSVFDSGGLEFARSQEYPYIKIASTDLNNYPFLERVALSGQRCLLSTGLSTLSEVEEAVRVFDRAGVIENLSLLHCVSVYPCPVGGSRISRIKALKACFGLPVGYSDHTVGCTASAMAITLGATILEKHFTFDQSSPGFDHAHALNSGQLKSYVAEMREAALATAPTYRLSEEEMVTAVRARRGLYAARDLVPGHILGPDDVLIVRPSNDLQPQHLRDLIGSEVQCPIKQFEGLSLKALVCASSSRRWREADGYWREEMKEKGISG